MQRYTVKEVCGLAGVTVKTLYHYQKIGLLEPCEVTTAGYRLYSDKELARLQQILFYRELGFSLRDIKHALEHESERIHVLTKQQQLLLQRKAQLDQMLRTIADTIAAERKGKTMDKHEMFKGLNKQQWQETLKEQKEYLENRYGYEMDTDHIDAEKLNEAAAESERFMHELAEAYAGGCGLTMRTSNTSSGGKSAFSMSVWPRRTPRLSRQAPDFSWRTIFIAACWRACTSA